MLGRTRRTTLSPAPVDPASDKPGELASMRVAIWMAGALALGWLGTAAAGLVFPGGHPPAAFVFGEGMVLASFLLAPIGVGAVSVELWRARRRGTGAPPLAMAMLGLNLLFLLVAIALWFWIWSEATRR